MNTPKVPTLQQKIATQKLIQQNKSRAAELLLRMQLGLKIEGKTNG